MSVFIVASVFTRPDGGDGDGLGRYAQSILDSFKTISKVKDRDGGHPPLRRSPPRPRNVSALFTRTPYVAFSPFELIIIFVIIIITLTVRMRHQSKVRYVFL